MIYHVAFTRDYTQPSAYNTFADLQECVDDAVATLTPVMGDFDVIAVQGTSGQSIGFPVCLELQKRGWRGKIVVVRKPGEESHSGLEWITGGSVHSLRCLFLDDFVSLGSTRTRVRRAIEGSFGTLVAQYTSRDDSYSTL